MSVSAEAASDFHRLCALGLVDELQRFLLLRNGPLAELLSCTHEGTTPLIRATLSKQQEVVRFLVEMGHVDLEERGQVRVDNEDIRGATALWTASATGNLECVRYLLDHGALVNQPTDSGSTALRVACYEGHLSVVDLLCLRGAEVKQRNKRGHTPLMIACYNGHGKVVRYLLDKGADPMQPSQLSGRLTAFNDAAESGHMEIFKMLLDTMEARLAADSSGGEHRAAKDSGKSKCSATDARKRRPIEHPQDSLSPLLSAALGGHVEMLKYLMGCDRFSHTKLDVIQAQELMGTSFYFKLRNAGLAMMWWTRAVTERQRSGLEIAESSTRDKEQEEEEEMAQRGASLPACYWQREATTLDELQGLDDEGVASHALSVGERVLGQDHPKTVYHLRFQGAIYADQGDYEKCLALWRRALNLQLANTQQNGFVTANMLQTSAEVFDELDNSCIIEWSTHAPYIRHTLHSTVQHFHNMSQVAVNADRSPPPEITALTMRTVLHLLSVWLNHTQDNTTEADEVLLVARRLVRLRLVTANGDTLLHVAADATADNLDDDYALRRMPRAQLVQLLLDAGLSPHARTCDGRTPLHVMLETRLDCSEAVRCLLRHGAHIDARSMRGSRPLDALHTGDVSPSVAGVLSPHRLLSLRCLAAAAVAGYGVPFEAVVPRRLIPFVQLH